MTKREGRSRTGMPDATPARPDYGMDAPGIRRGMEAAGIGGFLLALAAAVAAAAASGFWFVLAALATITFALVAVYGCGMAGFMTFTSRIGKLHERDRLLDLAGRVRPWTGEERVLDVGCGRGLMLVGAAKRLTSGTATGIDLWRAEDQAGNTPDAPLANARREGVADRVVVETGDACALPYEDASFDAVLSHWAVHNLPAERDRDRALDEMIRVLRPGGVLVLADIAHHDAYRARLATRGLSRIRIVSGGMASVVLGLLSGGTFTPQAIVGLRSR